MKVRLAHAHNPDIRPGGYWTQPHETGQPRIVPVTTFEHASRTCRLYIELNELGGGNWTGGQILDDDGKQIAFVSYNGRVWEGHIRDDFRNRKEIQLRD